MKYKAKYGVRAPNVIRGGKAIPMGNNLYWMSGRQHDNGGIDIGKDLEVENNEVMQMLPNETRVFSSLPMFNGASPAELVANGNNPNLVFNAQEQWKKVNRIKDDGTSYRDGGIHIKPENRGKFTEAAKRRGMSVSQLEHKVLANKENYSTSLVKQAVFSNNARKWKKKAGGRLISPNVLNRHLKPLGGTDDYTYNQQDMNLQNIYRNPLARAGKRIKQNNGVIVNIDGSGLNKTMYLPSTGRELMRGGGRIKAEIGYSVRSRTRHDPGRTTTSEPNENGQTKVWNRNAIYDDATYTITEDNGRIRIMKGKEIKDAIPNGTDEVMIEKDGRYYLNTGKNQVPKGSSTTSGQMNGGDLAEVQATDTPSVRSTTPGGQEFEEILHRTREQVKAMTPGLSDIPGYVASGLQLASSIGEGLIANHYLNKMQPPKEPAPIIPAAYPTRYNNNAELAVNREAYNEGKRDLMTNYASSAARNKALNTLSYQRSLADLKSYETKFNKETEAKQKRAELLTEVNAKNVENYNKYRDALYTHYNGMMQNRALNWANMVKGIGNSLTSALNNYKSTERIRANYVQAMLPYIAGNGRQLSPEEMTTLLNTINQGN